MSRMKDTGFNCCPSDFKRTNTLSFNRNVLKKAFAILPKVYIGEIVQLPSTAIFMHKRYIRIKHKSFDSTYILQHKRQVDHHISRRPSISMDNPPCLTISQYRCLDKHVKCTRPSYSELMTPARTHSFGKRKF